MRVVVLSRERTDYARNVETFLGDFEHRTGEKLETVDPDSPEGVSFCTAYGIVEFPTVIAIADGMTGEMQKMWSGLPLPTINEVSYYLV